MRGNPALPKAVTNGSGSIPACAGEPDRYGHPASEERVYPRLCGGTSAPLAPVGLAAGLSPPVRGNPFLTSAATSPGGSIPACAGEPEIQRSEASLVRVYPRLCGGTMPATDPDAIGSGLSPPVRGNLSMY